MIWQIARRLDEIRREQNGGGVFIRNTGRSGIVKAWNYDGLTDADKKGRTTYPKIEIPSDDRMLDFWKAGYIVQFRESSHPKVPVRFPIVIRSPEQIGNSSNVYVVNMRKPDGNFMAQLPVME